GSDLCLVDPGPQCFRVHTELVTDTAEDTAAGTRVGFEGVEDHADRSLTKLEGVFLLGHDREVLSVASLSPLFPGRIRTQSVRQVPQHGSLLTPCGRLAADLSSWLTVVLTQLRLQRQEFGSQVLLLQDAAADSFAL